MGGRHEGDSSTPGWSHLLRNLAGAFNQLLLGVGIAGAALEGSSVGHKSGTAMAQLLHSVLNVGANLDGSMEFKKAPHWLPVLPWDPSMGGRRGRGMRLFHKPTLELSDSPLTKGPQCLPCSRLLCLSSQARNRGNRLPRETGQLSRDRCRTGPACPLPTTPGNRPAWRTLRCRVSAAASKCSWQDHLQGSPLPQLSCPPSPLHSLL